MLEPEKNPTPGFIVDPPGWLRMLISKRVLGPEADRAVIERRREKAELRRIKQCSPHVVDYFHQLDDPYSHLTAQVLGELVARYEIELRVHLIRATGGKAQPEFEKLAVWARRDAELIAPYFGLSFPSSASTVPHGDHLTLAGRTLAGDVGLGSVDLQRMGEVSQALWSGDEQTLVRLSHGGASLADLNAVLNVGSELLSKLKHYSGATFYYGGEWYWGVDRLYHLEKRLSALGASRKADSSVMCPRPEIDLDDVDASQLQLDFYPSLNSPYSAIIYDEAIAVKEACGIQFNHKPVLPMVMRGVPAPMDKGRYIVFDTKREAERRGVPFGDLVMPIGEPTRRAYSLLPWAMSQGKDETLMSSLLRHAFAMGVGLHKEAGMRRAVEAAGLDWNEAQQFIDGEDWKPMVEANQDEMVGRLGLWGVPSFRLSSPDGSEEDLAVWGQDRLWLIAADIRRRVNKQTPF
jgi:2-hydroxychromene-2-carboxylate isomerase